MRPGWSPHGWSALLLALAFLAGVVAGCTGLAATRTGAQSVEVVAALTFASEQEGVPYATLWRLARCESGFAPWAENRRSGAMGLMQFLPGTWAWMSEAAGYAGTSAYDPWSASLVTAWAIRSGYGRHWACW